MNTLFTDEPKIEPPSESDEADAAARRLQMGVKRRLTTREQLHQLWLRATLQVDHYPSRRVAARKTFLILLGASAVFGVLSGLALVYSVDMPQMDELARYRPSTTTELLDVHGTQIGSFALERRVVVPYSDLPKNLKDAIISIEDKSFERNWGLNLGRMAEAAYTDVHSGGRAQGGSTLTMQLARNLFLSSQKTFTRKLEEIFLTIQIERRFSKEQIFALYANQIYLGHGRYGFEAGSQFYFSKHVKDLTLAQAALLAALPKGPEYYSPIRNPERAETRRNLVLTEMARDGKITDAQETEAKAEPLGLKIETPPETIAPYFVEEVRRQLEREYGAETVHGAGLRVYTTLDLNLQKVANEAVLDGTARYERRHGWKGHLQNVIAGGLDATTYVHPDWTKLHGADDYLHGMVTSIAKNVVEVKLGRQHVTLTPGDWAWTAQGNADHFLKLGDLVYVRITSMDPDGSGRAALEQDSGAQASLMAIDNGSGEVLALVGGRDYALSVFNRATQAQRQVGSSFKPYVYTAAIESGMTPSSIVVDAPTSFHTPGGGYYTPHNYEHGFMGAMTLTRALALSSNIAALKLADKVGIRDVIATARRFGITSDLPPYLPVAIGAASLTLAEQTGAYMVFPNDGVRIEPHYIRRVTQSDGVPLEAKNPVVSQVTSVETARAMMVMLQAVTQYGTAGTVSSLHHPFGGKTGTTNDYTDAWFVGFSPSVTCGVWVGFDTRETLGKGETGAKAALPIWTDFMKEAIDGKDDETFPSEGAPKKRLAIAANSAGASKAVKGDEDDPDAMIVGDSGTDAATPVTAPEAPPSAPPVAPAPVVVAPPVKAAPER